MKKITLISLIGLLVGANVCFGYDPMNPQIQKLIATKQEKMAALEKCEGNKKGFMIAGLSTLGLTGVGVAGNVVLARKNRDLQKKTVSADLPSIGTKPVLYSSYDIEPDKTVGRWNAEEEDWDEEDGLYGISQTGEWYVGFEDGKAVSGVAVCSSSHEEYFGQSASDNEAVQAEYNAWVSSGRQQSVGSDKTYCYCKMTSPRNSHWILYYNKDSAEVCARICAYDCATEIAERDEEDADFRYSLFNN